MSELDAYKFLLLPRDPPADLRVEALAGLAVADLIRSPEDAEAVFRPVLEAVLHLFGGVDRREWFRLLRTVRRWDQGNVAELQFLLDGARLLFARAVADCRGEWRGLPTLPVALAKCELLLDALAVAVRHLPRTARRFPLPVVPEQN
jgi:hypothetical protein